jgi:hypothetical protein
VFASALAWDLVSRTQTRLARKRPCPILFFTQIPVPDECSFPSCRDDTIISCQSSTVQTSLSDRDRLRIRIRRSEQVRYVNQSESMKICRAIWEYSVSEVHTIAASLAWQRNIGNIGRK